MSIPMVRCLRSFALHYSTSIIILIKFASFPLLEGLPTYWSPEFIEEYGLTPLQFESSHVLLPRIHAGTITVEELQALVSSDSSVLNERVNGTKGPIFVASYGNRLELLDALLLYPETKPELDQHCCCSAIFPASAKGYNEVVQALIKHGISLDKQNGEIHTPLLPAAHFGRLDLVEYFIDLGMGDLDSCTTESSYSNALEWVKRAIYGDHLPVLQFALNWLLPLADTLMENHHIFYAYLMFDAHYASAVDCLAWLKTDETIRIAFDAVSSIESELQTYFYIFAEGPNPNSQGIEAAVKEYETIAALMKDESLDLPSILIPSDQPYPLNPVSCCVVALSLYPNSPTAEAIRPIIIDCLRYLLSVGCSPSDPFILIPMTDPEEDFYCRVLDPAGLISPAHYGAGLIKPILLAVYRNVLDVVQILFESPQFQVSDLLGCHPFLPSSPTSSTAPALANLQNDALTLSLLTDALMMNWVVQRMEEAGLLQKVVNLLLLGRCIHFDSDLALRLLHKFPEYSQQTFPQTGLNLLSIALRNNETKIAKCLLEDPIFNNSFSTHYFPGTFGLCVDERHKDAVKLMVARKSEFGTFKPFSEESLVFAAFSSILTIPSTDSDLEMLNLLVHEAGVPVEPIDLKVPEHPFFPALSMGYVPVLEFFGSLEPSVVDFEHELDDGLSMLHYLSAYTKANEDDLCKSLRFLLSKVSLEFASYSVVNSLTPLIEYAIRGRSKLVKIMLEAGVRWQWRSEMVLPPGPRTRQEDYIEKWPKSAVSAAIHKDHLSVLRVFFEFIGTQAFVTADIHDAIASGACECFDFLVDTIFPWFLPPNTTSAAPIKSYQRQAAERAEKLYDVATMYGSWAAMEHLAYARNLIRFMPQCYLPEMRHSFPRDPMLWKRLFERGLVGTYMNYTKEETRFLLPDDLPRHYPYQQKEIHDKTLWKACSDGDLPMVKALYHSGANLHKFELHPHPRSALLCACLSDQIEVARWLMSKGCTLADLLPAAELILHQLGADIKRLLLPWRDDI